jgi:ElaB/YqjD/DUF883 family membrane-anchored ribosome-binding protein
MQEPTNPEKLSKKAKEVSTEVRQTATEAVDQARSAIQAVWLDAKNEINLLQIYTREHPGRVVFFALGMGLVLGSFARR